MNELQEKYSDQIEFIAYDLTIAENACEYNRHDEWVDGTIPAMLYIDKEGNTVEVSEDVLEVPQLEQKLQNLLSQ